MRGNLKVILILLIIYSLHLWINFAGLNPFGLSQTYLITMLPEFNSVCLFLPLAFILAIHLLLFQKDLKISESNRKLRLACFILLYLNITLTVYWVFSVQSQINEGYEIATEIEKYYEINKKYPESIDAILLDYKIDSPYNNNIRQVYSYEFKNSNSYTFVIHPKEIEWVYFKFNDRTKKFELIDD